MLLQPLREFEAMADRMIEPDLDQLVADRQRDQPLGRLARHAELAGDLILGVAGDVIEPAGAGGVVEPVGFQLRCFRHDSPSRSGADDNPKSSAGGKADMDGEDKGGSSPAIAPG